MGSSSRISTATMSSGFFVPRRWSAHGRPHLDDARRQSTVPKIASGTGANYVGENTNATPTEPTFGQVQLTARKLVALCPISNDLIRYSSPQADTLVRDDLVSGIATAEDAAFIPQRRHRQRAQRACGTGRRTPRR